MKVVVNRCHGGFDLSDKATEMIMNKKGLNCFRYKWENDEYVRCESFNREDWLTYYLTEDLGEKINKIPTEVYWWHGDIERYDSDLIAVVEELGEEANGRFAELEIVEIPDDVNWEIDDYDGYETIEEVHRVW